MGSQYSSAHDPFSYLNSFDKGGIESSVFDVICFTTLRKLPFIVARSIPQKDQFATPDTFQQKEILNGFVSNRARYLPGTFRAVVSLRFPDNNVVLVSDGGGIETVVLSLRRDLTAWNMPAYVKPAKRGRVN